jgi:hypothetical protein
LAGEQRDAMKWPRKSGSAGNSRGHRETRGGVLAADMQRGADGERFG